MCVRARVGVICVFVTEPEKQFALVQKHVHRIRQVPELSYSQVIIMVERNLGFEAEHHERALNGLPLTRFRVDHSARRFGILTTEEVKYGMMTLFNNMLRDQRIAFCDPLLSEDGAAPRAGANEGLLVPVQTGRQLPRQTARRALRQGRLDEGRRRHRPPARCVLQRAPGDVRVIFSSLCGRIHIKDIQNRVGSENGPGLRSCDAGCRLCVQR